MNIKNILNSTKKVKFKLFKIFVFEQLEDFISDNQEKLGSGQRAIEQSLEQTRTNINWRNSYEDDVYNWLKNR